MGFLKEIIITEVLLPKILVPLAEFADALDPRDKIAERKRKREEKKKSKYKTGKPENKTVIERDDKKNTNRSSFKEILLSITNPLFWAFMAVFFRLLADYNGPRSAPILNFITSIICVVIAVITFVFRIPLWIHKLSKKPAPNIPKERTNTEQESNITDESNTVSKNKRKLF